ncbi:TetR/AcrR family transcriptional regulator [Solimonas sp. C16B3]|uniref:TetR/AcrR family transcriptional regulator n=2 Tax=Solimonas marina TaxID=2714601 RepID=A0A969WGH5_9GAMM|nr:TetR/AcrR family transcriptional regulator [Solimonas marina]
MLDAAEAVVVQQGAVRLTLDAVAKQAGVSKGGVMYHFPSKEALLQALVTRAMERSYIARTRLQPDSPAPGDILRAYVQASVGDPLGNLRVSSALLAVVASDPTLMAPVREFFSKRLPSIAPGVPFERAAIVHLATEGLWLMDLFGASPFTKKQRTQVVKLLGELAGNGGTLP